MSKLDDEKIQLTVSVRQALDILVAIMNQISSLKVNLHYENNQERRDNIEEAITRLEDMHSTIYTLSKVAMSE